MNLISSNQLFGKESLLGPIYGECTEISFLSLRDVQSQDATAV